MSETNGATDLVGVRNQSRKRRKFSLVLQGQQRCAFYKLHAQINDALVLANIVDGNDVGMVQIAGGLGFLFEPLHQFVVVGEVAVHRNSL